MVNKNSSEHDYLETNYLTNLKAPPIGEEHMYDSSKGQKKDFTYIKGIESHLIRRKLILTKYPEIAKLLIADKPYTIIIALGVIALAMANCYWARNQSMWILLLDAYLIGGLLNHTLHCCIHDFTHFGGHANMNINKVMAALCNIPMAIPSALSFGRYHSDHHNFLGEEMGDPDLPLRWQSQISQQHKWYKYAFYMFIEVFYALRPVFMNKPSLSRDQLLNYLFIFTTNYLIYHCWGFNAFLFCLVAGLSSIGPHPAAVHIIAEHYQFIKGQETYDYLGFWNFFNLDLGYHIEHHDFPNAPWYNLRKIRKIAPQFYEYLPHHTSYWKVWKKFITDINFNLFYRTIRVMPKAQ